MTLISLTIVGPVNLIAGSTSLAHTDTTHTHTMYTIALTVSIGDKMGKFLFVVIVSVLFIVFCRSMAIPVRFNRGAFVFCHDVFCQLSSWVLY